MKLAIGLGLHKDPAKAAEAAVRQALKTVPKPGLALAFSSIALDQAKEAMKLAAHKLPIKCKFIVKH